MGEGRGLWVRAKTIISDRDRRRLCENVFMCVCARRQQGSLAGGFNSKWTCEDRSVKSVSVRGMLGSRAVLCRRA